MSRRGGPKVVFNLLLTFFFWLASLASIKQTYYIQCTSKFNTQCMERSSFLYIPLIQIIIMKIIQLPIPCIHERAFSYFFLVQNYTILHHLRQKSSGGGPPDPPHRHIYNIKLPCHLYVSVEKRFQLYKKTMPYRK